MATALVIWCGPGGPALAQGGGSLLRWGIVLLGAVLLLGLVAAAVRRMAMGIGSRRPEGLTIEQLDELHRQGTISEAEYKRMRRSVLGLNDTARPGRQADEAAGTASGDDESGPDRDG